MYFKQYMHNVLLTDFTFVQLLNALDIKLTHGVMMTHYHSRIFLVILWGYKWARFVRGTVVGTIVHEGGKIIGSSQQIHSTISLFIIQWSVTCNSDGVHAPCNGKHAATTDR